MRVRSIHHSDTGLPDQVFINPVQVLLSGCGYILNREARLEQEYRYTLHHLDGINLVTEYRLLPPHTINEKFLVFEQNRESANEYVDAPFEGLSMPILCYGPLLRGDIMHHLYDLDERLDCGS